MKNVLWLEVKYSLGLYGGFVGAFMVVSVLLHDIFWQGFRHYFDGTIGVAGRTVALIGVALMLVSKYYSKKGI